MSSEIEEEAARVRQAYARRAERGLDNRYDYWTPANLFIYQSRERTLLSLLRKKNRLPLAGKRILDAGCGDGSLLYRLGDYGAQPADLHGVDLLPERIAEARRKLPTANIEVSDCQRLPFADASFDIVLGFTLLSSVVGAEARRRVSAELRRVLAVGGLIVLYDFWINPLNRDARPLRRNDVSMLFPGGEIDFAATTLAPPIVRALTPWPGGTLACSLLEVLPFLKTHFLATVQPR